MEQTLIEPTEYLKNVFKADNVKSESEIIVFVLKKLKELNLVYGRDKEKVFLNQRPARTAEQILKDGYINGCTDDAILFIAAVRSFGLKPIYVEVIEKSWLESPMEQNTIRGHAYVEMDDILVDPQRKIIYIDPDFIKTRYIVFGKANEPFQLGLTDFKTIVQKFMDFKEKYQAEHKLS
ncbi:MAG: hypothetical protein A2418_00555 [Candidatus Brennerbacteria bacterium RIFOXYC1_FULL_41_11]|uniref:Transglutaminase-like domain-containing protein n=1 Tax=Candidatus Brennerbacteria bacterium RIFOXYD1_FULL_41_16 TaxID=1797529 RepID=A0A1G1XL65_9BACT|nr:MAG: hypothetical protein A2418_00555 [Candidatus Brennerbacteria bacterium RIFOXYC1_FULL_41_11]OGY40350.1 MAG: hypothetical protein A2570_03680 [Candidatus Brennerbacteria bacterium RIFOXYD1_FULL_41_16]